MHSVTFEIGSNMVQIGLDGKMQALVHSPRACILPSSPPYQVTFYTSYPIVQFRHEENTIVLFDICDIIMFQYRARYT